MALYFYFSILPEALIASMLPPEDFCAYLAVGTKKHASDQAILFEVSSEFESDFFDLSNLEKRCAPHHDGTPKHSLYLCIYRVLEHLPLKALKDLYLVTRDARILQLPKTSQIPPPTLKLHLYQELCPVSPLVASALEPREFCRFMTNPAQPIHVPKLFFTELRLGELGTNPEAEGSRDLPYRALMHLRDCLRDIKSNPQKHTKTVDRIPPRSDLYRLVESGFYIGGQEEIYFYPFPSELELEDKYHAWWRSATL